jgi:hypothetical protein
MDTPAADVIQFLNAMHAQTLTRFFRPCSHRLPWIRQQAGLLAGACLRRFSSGEILCNSQQRNDLYVTPAAH